MRELRSGKLLEPNLVGSRIIARQFLAFLVVEICVGKGQCVSYIIIVHIV